MLEDFCILKKNQIKEINYSDLTSSDNHLADDTSIFCSFLVEFRRLSIWMILKRAEHGLNFNTYEDIKYVKKSKRKLDIKLPSSSSSIRTTGYSFPRKLKISFSFSYSYSCVIHQFCDYPRVRVLSLSSHSLFNSPLT